MSWVLAFAGFAALIVLHEGGHFAAAKAVGMRVEKFSLFFGPMLVKFQRGETTYGIGPIPLGGYVKITGQNPYEELDPEVAPRAYYRQPVWKRVVVILAGPVVNIVLAFLLLWGIFAIRGVDTKPTRQIASIESGKPASGVLRDGDVLVAVDGRGGSTAQLAKRISSHRCPPPPKAGCAAATPVRVTVRRSGARRTFALTPRYDPVAKRTRLGFGFKIGTRPLPVGEAASQSVSAMWFVTHTTVDRVVRIFFSSKARKDVSGVVGSYEATRQSFELSTARALSILALISLSLGVVNLFPFLPLDGGHIFWALAEKLRGRAIPFRVMERASFVGFALVIFLFVVGLSNDIGRLTGPGFGIQ